MAGIKIVLVGATFQRTRAFGTVQAVQEVLDVLKAGGVDTIDTAQIYGDSETLIGEADAGASFIIDTKAAGGFNAGSPTKDGIIAGAKESLQKLRVAQVSIVAMHNS